MPTLEWNRTAWNDDYEWPQAGDEWSDPWGGVRAQWWGLLFPRLQRLLPADAILEIGPGFGRWTQFLQHHCRRLIAVDLNPRCIEACKERFAGSAHMTFFVNDGKALDMIEDESIDLAFSFDSLVHANADVLEAYIEQMSRKLTANGVAFLHHSNLGAYRYHPGMRATGLRLRVVSGQALATVLPEKVYAAVRSAVRARLSCPEERGRDVTHGLVRRLCEAYGLACIRQELVNWTQGRALIDCFSLLTRRTSALAEPPRVFYNRDLMAQARLIRWWA